MEEEAVVAIRITKAMDKVGAVVMAQVEEEVLTIIDAEAKDLIDLVTTAEMVVTDHVLIAAVLTTVVTNKSKDLTPDEQEENLYISYER